MEDKNWIWMKSDHSKNEFQSGLAINMVMVQLN
jgi:hypothetical protein